MRNQTGRLRAILESARSKAKSERGDTLVEVLVSIAISALALTLLAMAIAIGASSIHKSNVAMDEGFELESSLAMTEPAANVNGSVLVTDEHGSEIQIAPSADDLDVTYSIPDVGQPARIPIVAYSVEEG